MKTFSPRIIITIAMMYIFAFMASGTLSAANKTINKKTTQLQISFQYNKQQGPGSNQYAVWIEDMNGNVVKTLFVTSFTSKGRPRQGQKADRGYHFRPTCVPTWVKHANADALTDVEVDGFTGATPQVSGLQSFLWNFTDQNGKPVKSGTYKFYVEATYYNSSIVLYEGEFNNKKVINWKKSEVQPTTEHANMVSDFTAIVK